MRSSHHVATVLLITAVLAGTTWAAAAHPLPQRDGHGLMVGSSGYTLYTYDPDGSTGQSQCIGSCAAVWPPYAADAGATASGDFSVTVRADGIHQWTYRAHPLYRYAGDSRPGTHAGDGVNGVWHTVH